MLPDIVNFDKICRTCLIKANDNLKMRSILDETIYTDTDDRIQLSMLLETCTSIIVTSKDKLPPQICQQCFNSLQDYYRFRKQCEKSERVLLEIIEQIRKRDLKEMKHFNEAPVTEPEQGRCSKLVEIKLETIKDEADREPVNDNTPTKQMVNDRAVDQEKSGSCSVYVSSECKDYMKPKQSQNYICQICMKQLKNNEGLKKHMFTHQPVKSYKCNQCDKSFRRSDYLSRHQKLHRRVDQNTQSCTCHVCEKRLSTPGALQIHMKRHQNVKDYICTYCGKCFITKTSLIVHERTHTDERPFKCDICGKCFVQNISLSRHMNTHTGEKPYECTECGQRCFTTSHLKLHMLIHTGERPHKCIVCSKAFRVPGYLKQHMKFHTGDYEFFCSYCNKGFHLSSKLKNHLRMHTGEKPFPCLVCGKKFSQSTYRYIHMKNMHKDKLTKHSKIDGLKQDENT